MTVKAAGLCITDEDPDLSGRCTKIRENAESKSSWINQLFKLLSTMLIRILDKILVQFSKSFTQETLQKTKKRNPFCEFVGPLSLFCSAWFPDSKIS